jgi:hypothetical protein
MATIMEEMESQIEREKQEKRNKIELKARMKAYENIASIKKWIVFWSILGVIFLAISVIAWFDSVVALAS